MSQPPRTSGGVDRDLVTALVLVDQLQPALERGDRAKQNDIVKKLVALRAPMGEQWRALAVIAARNGDLGLAREALDLFADAMRAAPPSS